MLRRFINRSSLRSAVKSRNLAAFSLKSVHGQLLRANPTAFTREINQQQRRTYTTTTEAAETPEPNAAGIVEITDATFEKIVGASTVPVILDFYADWCQPCKVLTPLLEKYVKAAPKGSVLLGKVNIDFAPQLQAAFKIEQVPTVFAIYNQKVIGNFTGVVEEQNISAMVAQLSEVGAQVLSQRPNFTSLLDEANASFQKGDTATAAQQYSNIVVKVNESKESLQPAETEQLKTVMPRTYAGLALCSLMEGKSDNAKAWISQAEEEYGERATNDDDIKMAKSKIEFAEKASKLLVNTSVEKLEQAIQQDGNDLVARYQLATLHFLQGKPKEAIDEALALTKIQKRNREVAAAAEAKLREMLPETAEKDNTISIDGHQLLLTMFDALGRNDSLAMSGRRRLAGILF